MARKRNRDEFEQDRSANSDGARDLNRADGESDAAEATSSTKINQSLGIRSRDGAEGEADDDEGWQLAGPSKKKKKKLNKKQKKAEAALGPSLRFDPNRDGAPVRVKDLQALVLYVLADGVAPTWVAVQNSREIRQVLVLMIPGMDREMLESAVSRINSTEQFREEMQNGQHQQEASKPKPEASDGVTDLIPRRILSMDSIIAVKAPGDSKTGRMHSPLQSMLISPEPTSTKKSGVRGPDIFHPTQTPLSTFIHTAEELVDAEYAVHPASFTNEADAAFEQARRREASQSTPDGWVDTMVSSSTPVFPLSTSTKPNPLTQNLTIYALDCEMVLTSDTKLSLARISILDWAGTTVLDTYVQPTLPITNYYTQFSGITAQKLESVTTTLADIQSKLLTLLTPSTVLLGHSLESDLGALKLTHPFIVDTALIYPHPRGLPLRSSLKFLANKYLKREIQRGGGGGGGGGTSTEGHDSVEDARAVLDLVRLKCQKGPQWGTLDANGESIFSRIGRTVGREGTAIVEFGTPERGFGRHAGVKVGCAGDGEVVEGLKRVLGRREEGGGGGGGEGVAFAWGRFREMEGVRGWNLKRAGVVKEGEEEEKVAEGEEGYEERVKKMAEETVGRLVEVYESLEKGTLVIVYPGPGDMREVLRLQEMQKQYRREFKVKKWDELSVKWTDDEQQALKKAFEEARKGSALVCVK